MLRIFNIPANVFPGLSLVDRATLEPLPGTISGLPVQGYPTIYDFDLVGISDGYYLAMMANPQGIFYLRVLNGVGHSSNDWAALELLGVVPVAPVDPVEPDTILEGSKKYKTDDQEVEQYGLDERVAYERFQAEKNAVGGKGGWAAVRMGRARLGSVND